MRFDCVRRQPNARPPTGELATASQRNFRIVESAYPSEHLSIDTLAFVRYKHVFAKMQGAPMSEKKRDYEIGYGKPPKGRPFQKGQSGNPRTPRGQNGFAALLAAELDERVTITINGRRRRMTNREAIVAQMVDKSTRADLRAIKMLAACRRRPKRRPARPPNRPPPPNWRRKTARSSSCSWRDCASRSPPKRPKPQRQTRNCRADVNPPLRMPASRTEQQVIDLGSTMTMPGSGRCRRHGSALYTRSPLFKPGASPGPPLSRGGDEKEKRGTICWVRTTSVLIQNFVTSIGGVSRHPGGGAGIHPGHRYRPPPVGCG